MTYAPDVLELEGLRLTSEASKVVCPKCQSENLVSDPRIESYIGDGCRWMTDAIDGFACLDCGYSSHEEDLKLSDEPDEEPF